MLLRGPVQYIVFIQIYLTYKSNYSSTCPMELKTPCMLNTSTKDLLPCDDAGK
jgi:hypothetical protein